MQVPLPLQISLVQGLPSSGQATPLALLVMTQRLMATSQVACLQRLTGCLQVGKSREQLHLPLPRHLPVLQSLSVSHAEPPLSGAAAASRMVPALSTPPRLIPL